ncbi:MAG: site-specific DNA-methyltransferase [Opitutaceae bacterium]|nr:site-specific DNA-methyltransferase [Opitutaceae bacterium]
MSRPFPTQSQLLLPVMETIAEMGGSAEPSVVIDAVAERLGIPDGIKNDFRTIDTGKWGLRKRSAFRQCLHWVRMTAVTAGLISRTERGRWTLTDKGKDSLVTCQPGLILIVYETPDGQAVWADAITTAGAVADNTVNLLFTSPPYPILNGRKYGTFTEAEIVELIVRCARGWRRALMDDGSLVINTRDCWLPKAASGGTVRSLWQEKLLLALCEDVKLYFADRLWWRNPSHLPDNPWVTVKKCRCNCDVESLLWLSKGPNPRANNQNILADAAPSTIQAYVRKARRGALNHVGPSTHNNLFEEQIGAVMAGQSLKVIPRNLLEFSNGDTHHTLTHELKELGLPRHDAMMPVKLAEHIIRFLTVKGDLVWDPFFGSGTTGVAAEKLGRRWIGSDRSLAHLLGSALRFENTTFEPPGQPG